MRVFVLTATYELRVSRKSHLRGHPLRRSDPVQIRELDPGRSNGFAAAPAPPAPASQLSPARGGGPLHLFAAQLD
jgi:hypothetical protein